MKKAAAALALLFVFAVIASAEVLSVDPEATPKPIKITVEGVPDAKPTSLTTQKDVFFKNALFQPQPKNPAAEIKKMAESNVMESEIIDAIITKLSDIEEELKMQKIYNMRLTAGSLVMLALVLFLFFTRKK